MPKRPEYVIAREDLSAALAAMKIDVECRFVPFDQSRSRDEKMPSLNWLCDLTRNGVVVMRGLDYMQGSAHCPAYSNPKFDQWQKAQAVAIECNCGRIVAALGGDRPYATARDISPPSVVDIMASLCLDADVLNYAKFADWADNFGFDSDSIKAERIYRACLETALGLRAMLGDETLAKFCELANQL